MDYEKAYKEALERARKLQENSNGMILKKWLWNIFPELKESEDEKIRKEILEYFQQFENEELHGVNISDWIAWLEKQSEQKPAEWSEEDEQNRQIINKAIYEYVGEDGITQGETGKLIQWLKSINNHWKPSEEQMKALEKECFANSNYQLCRLLEDLKKL